MQLKPSLILSSPCFNNRYFCACLGTFETAWGKQVSRSRTIVEVFSAVQALHSKILRKNNLLFS